MSWGFERIKEDVVTALAVPYGGFGIEYVEDWIVIEGEFPLIEDGILIESYALRIEISKDYYPYARPIVWELSDKFPHTPKRHCFRDGDCCVALWEEWMLIRPDPSFRTYLDVAARNYFLSQFLFEHTGEWPYGQREHNYFGIQAAFSELLGVEDRYAPIVAMLGLLSHRYKVDRRPCYCGSNLPVRKCHQAQVATLMQKLDRAMAVRMLNKLDNSSEIEIAEFEELREREAKTEEALDAAIKATRQRNLG